VVQADGLARVLTGIRYTLEVKKMCYRRSCKHTISRTGDACQWSGQLQYGDDMGVIQGYYYWTTEGYRVLTRAVGVSTWS